MPARPASSCPTGKRRFRDRVGALLALADIGTSERSNRQESRAYRCPDCSGWHLTSKPRYESPQITSWEGRRGGGRTYQPPRLDKGRDEE